MLALAEPFMTRKSQGYRQTLAIRRPLENAIETYAVYMQGGADSLLDTVVLNE